MDREGLNDNTFPALTIDRAALDELHKRALNCTLSPFTIAKLNYRETQQALTLKALSDYFESFGIQCPYELKLED